MSHSTTSTTRHHPTRRILGIAAFAGTLLLAAGLLSANAAQAAIAPDLGRAGDFSVLGGSTVTNTGATLLPDDLGVSPGTAITGFPPGIVLGETHAADADAIGAQSDLVTAYDQLASQATTGDIAGDLVGRTFTPGVYTASGPIGVTGTVTLDAEGASGAISCSRPDLR